MRDQQQQNGGQPKAPTPAKAKDNAPPYAKAPWKADELAFESGLAVADVQFLIRDERKAGVDLAGDFPSLQYSDAQPTAEQQLEANKCKNRIAHHKLLPLEDQDQDYINQMNNKINKILGISKNGGGAKAEVRFGHMLATNLEKHLDAQKALEKHRASAEQALKEAQERLTTIQAARNKQEENFRRRRDRIQAALDKAKAASSTNGDAPTLKPTGAASLSKTGAPAYTVPEMVACMSDLVDQLSMEYQGTITDTETKVMSGFKNLFQQKMSNLEFVSQTMDVSIDNTNKRARLATSSDQEEAVELIPIPPGEDDDMTAAPDLEEVLPAAATPVAALDQDEQMFPW